MSPTKEGRERALKAWETIRARRVAKTAESKKIGSKIPGEVNTREGKPNLYPKNWKEIVLIIRNRARNAQGQEQCECEGQCGKHQGRCDEINRTQARHSKGRIILTTAHLCHKPECARRAHLRSMCQLCHLLYDVELHALHRRERREREIGQKRLFTR